MGTAQNSAESACMSSIPLASRGIFQENNTKPSPCTEKYQLIFAAGGLNFILWSVRGGWEASGDTRFLPERHKTYKGEIYFSFHILLFLLYDMKEFIFMCFLKVNGILRGVAGNKQS